MSKLNKDILNEINRYREISGLRPIEEQERDINGNKIKKPKNSKKSEYREISPLSWKNGLSGKVNLDPRVKSAKEGMNLQILADNISSNNFYLVVDYSQPTVQPVSETDTEIITMPSFNLVGGDLNYNDNCVLPDISGGEAKVKFDNIVNSFVNYINNGGFNEIESIEIQGSADSGTPTLSNNDHIKAGYSKPFNGATDPYEMNQFLADERAKQYGLLVSDTVKESTGKDISTKYQYKEGINYWTKEGNPSKRGKEYRSITFKVNAPELKVADKVETTTTVTPVDETHKPKIINIYMPDGSIESKEGVQIITKSGAATKIKDYGFYEGDEALSEIIKIPRSIVKGKIENMNLILDGKQTCKLLPFEDWTKVISAEYPQSSGTQFFCRVTSQNVTKQGVMMVTDYIFQLKKVLKNPYAGYYGRG